MNNVKSRAQLSHFTDVEPLCLGCRVSNTIAHMFLHCQTIRPIVSSVIKDFLDIEILQITDIFDCTKLDQKFKKATFLILSACLFSSFNLDRRLKIPNIRAARNATIQICKIFAQTPKGKLYLENMRNTPLYNFIS